MASRCSTAFVEPPTADVRAMAFSNACLVMISRGVMPSSSIRTTAAPAALASPWRRASIAGGDAEPGRLMPIASPIELIVLAVNMPPHAPSPGQARRSISSSSSSLIVPGGVGADGLEHARDVEGPALVLAGHDRAVVDEDAGQVEAGRGHQHRRHRLVAAGHADEAVEALGEHDGLDRVAADLAADERAAHALVAHRDAVGHGDRAELEGHAAGLADARLDVLGERPQRHVAGRDLVPRVGDADLRLDPVVLGQPDRPQHRPGRRLGLAVGDVPGPGLDVDGLVGAHARARVPDAAIRVPAAPCAPQVRGASIAPAGGITARQTLSGSKPMLSSMNSLVTMSSAVRPSGGAWPSAV